MGKIKASQILVKDAKLKAIKLDENFAKELIISTRKKQSEVLKLKVVDLEELKLVVRL
jgi:hypothetical protein